MAFDVSNVLQKSTSLSEPEARFILATPAQSLGGTIGEVLSDREYTTADELVSELCKEMGIEFIKDIPINEIPADLVRNIPINYAKTHNILPLRDDGDTLVALSSNPLNVKSLDDLRVIFEKNIRPLITTTARLQDAINKVYERSTANLSGLDDIESEESVDLENQVVDLLDAGEDDAPVIKLVNSLLFRAIKEKASDIHIEPFEKDLIVRFRIDGILLEIFKPPKKLQNAIISRVKVMANLNIAEKRLPQDGRINLKLGGKDIDIRVNTMPNVFGEGVVMRIADRSNTVLELDQLGFSDESLKIFDEILSRSYGILLVTGPTGSGKSTTLYAALSVINRPDLKIITVEDPVEQRLHGINQTQAQPKINLTFAAALRAMLRQDPDVIMVGEIRDAETIETAIQASNTGHLVLSTLHTNDAAGAFPRMIDMGVEPFLIATAIQGVIAQRLVRILCPHCKLPYKPSDFELQSLGVSREVAENSNICRKVGCTHCNNKGYVGRTIIQEFLLVNDNIRSLILQRKDGSAIKKQAVLDGMVTFRDHGVQKVLSGITTIEELLSNTQTDL